jgi:hypothetical protein
VSGYRFESLELVTDFSAFSWIEPRLADTPTGIPPRVGTFVPEGFPAYARILHPGREWDGEQPRDVRWTDLAKRSGHSPHAEMQLMQIVEPTHPEAPLWQGEPPLSGRLPREQGRALVSLLPPVTGKCWMLVWEGWGALELPPHHPPRLNLPHRRYVVYRGPCERAIALDGDRWEQSASLWGPEDRSWIVVTEIDAFCTYVGGSPRLINRILASPALESWPITLDSPMDAGDTPVGTEG